jgi:sulfide:quinone oxidoreductase
VGKHILILGGGFGGLTAAHALRKGLGSEHKITLVDRQPSFRMGLTKLWILNNTVHDGEISGNREALAKHGVDFLEGEVTAIDASSRTVRVRKQQVRYDYLIIALGSDYSPQSTQGFTKNAKNLYNESGCAEIRDILETVKTGTLTVLVCGLPFKCPPAPYEASMIIDDVLRKKGVRDRVKLQVVTPEPYPLTTLGIDAGNMVIRLLDEREIEHHMSQKVIEIQRNGVVTESREIAHDLVFAIPVHVAPAVLKEAGLLDASGWIPVDPATMATAHHDVYAVGDCAGTRIPKGTLLPRAGIIAEEQAKVVATNIINEISGREKSAKFNGEGVCFMEVGNDEAMAVRANFYAEPAPKWEGNPPSTEGYQEKRRFWSERMKAWFV